MRWLVTQWRRLMLRLAIRRWPPEVAYAVPFRLYSADGKRSVEVRVRHDGLVYFVDQEWVEGTTFRNRGQGEEVGPYETLQAAEAAATIRPWFNSGQYSS